MDKFDSIWTSLISFGQVWSILDKFDPFWTSLIQFGQVWSNLDKFDPIQTSLIQFAQVRSNLTWQVWISVVFANLTSLMNGQSAFEGKGWKKSNDNNNNKKAITRWALCYAPIKKRESKPSFGNKLNTKPSMTTTQPSWRP